MAETIGSCPPPWPADIIAKCEADLRIYVGSSIKMPVIWLRDGDVARTILPTRSQWDQWAMSVTSTTVTSTTIAIRAREHIWNGAQTPQVSATIGYMLPGDLLPIGFNVLNFTVRITAALNLIHASAWGAMVRDDKIYVLCRPSVTVDSEGRPHCPAGPSVVWPHPEATNEYFLQGVRVPPEAILEPSKLPDIALGHPNVEVRRVLMSHYGHERILRERGDIVQSDECGALWAVGNTIRMVEVENSTPEPDGTRRKYMLRVPPDTRTARAGVAWTFNLRPTEYQPAVQT